MTRPWAGLRASVGGFLYRRIGRPPIRCDHDIRLNEPGFPCANCGALIDGQEVGR